MTIIISWYIYLASDAYLHSERHDYVNDDDGGDDWNIFMILLLIFIVIIIICCLCITSGFGFGFIFGYIAVNNIKIINDQIAD